MSRSAIAAFVVAATTAHGDASTLASRCKVESVCVIEGSLNASDGVGSVRDESGCVTVALPAGISASWNGKTVRVEGMIYAAVSTPGLVTYKLKDRTIDAEACSGGAAMYVDRIDLIGG